MRITLTERAQASIRAVDADRARVLDAILSLPAMLGQPHKHSGVGIRKLHRSGVWEARIGLGLRVVFTVTPGEIIVVMLGTHDEVQRFLRSL